MVCPALTLNLLHHKLIVKGIHQTNTPWADGVPGLSQRPIQPGASFKYKWYADQYGSYFYHAHSRGQIDDGAYGPIYIKPKAGAEKPFHLINPAEVDMLAEAEANVAPLILSDWRHRTSDETWRDQLASGLESAICMDSLLVNGKGSVDCWSREEIDAFTNPGIAPLLKANGLKFTNKGCLPPKMFQILLGNSTTINPGALPPGVFEICSPTQGPREVIKAPHDKKWLALDIMSTAGIDTFAFSIDEHPLWVYAVDSHYIEPLKVDVLTVANGDRYSVFIELNKAVGNYGIRVASLSLIQLIDTTAIFSYDGDYGHSYGPYKNNTNVDVVTSKPYANQAGQPTSEDVVVFNQAKIVSFPPQYPTIAPEIAQTFFMTMGNVGNSYTWALNSTPFNHPALDDSNPPLLYQTPNAHNPGGNITIATKNNTWVDLIFLVPGANQPPHPIHKHSNRAFIIGSGIGRFNWTSVAEAAKVVPQNFNFVTPPYRDGFVTPPSAVEPMWLAVRYHVVNPGAFMLHCHIQSHLNGGMAMVLLDGVDEWPEVPEDCKN
ncbi:multicopper oxidase [Cucurbitaria berberidis CBS 394.84]|uniref:Multicopper oxidase n=1 Tax=Cucurbitaria berberidis CBS 394.84 TaxID=1168544 RepID=A0A9P4L863_9PLEO|nr:multicopper oxidase [Cucurbitaria berberidis CBS 394.84]KAF1845017.1 multicopper oxidase [Cucurbitaria berberidis CBS 394.84]